MNDDKILIGALRRLSVQTGSIACELATFYAGEGWFFEAYPDWDDPQVTYWMPLPESPTIE